MLRIVVLLIAVFTLFSQMDVNAQQYHIDVQRYDNPYLNSSTYDINVRRQSQIGANIANIYKWHYSQLAFQNQNRNLIAEYLLYGNYATPTQTQPRTSPNISPERTDWGSPRFWLAFGGIVLGTMLLVDWD